MLTKDGQSSGKSNPLPHQIHVVETHLNQMHHTCLTKDGQRRGKLENLILSPTRYMLWKIQSGIAPPFFYVIVAEQDKLKTLRSFLCRENQNAVEPIAQLPMYVVNK